MVNGKFPYYKRWINMITFYNVRIFVKICIIFWNTVQFFGSEKEQSLYFFTVKNCVTHLMFLSFFFLSVVFIRVYLTSNVVKWMFIALFHYHVCYDNVISMCVRHCMCTLYMIMNISVLGLWKSCLWWAFIMWLSHHHLFLMYLSVFPMVQNRY